MGRRPCTIRSASPCVFKGRLPLATTAIPRRWPSSPRPRPGTGSRRSPRRRAREGVAEISGKRPQPLPEVDFHLRGLAQYLFQRHALVRPPGSVRLNEQSPAPLAAVITQQPMGHQHPLPIPVDHHVAGPVPAGGPHPHSGAVLNMGVHARAGNADWQSFGRQLAQGVVEVVRNHGQRSWVAWMDRREIRYRRRMALKIARQQEKSQL